MGAQDDAPCFLNHRIIELLPAFLIIKILRYSSTGLILYQLHGCKFEMAKAGLDNEKSHSFYSSITDSTILQSHTQNEYEREREGSSFVKRGNQSAGVKREASF